MSDIDSKTRRVQEGRSLEARSAEAFANTIVIFTRSPEGFRKAFTFRLPGVKERPIRSCSSPVRWNGWDRTRAFPATSMTTHPTSPPPQKSPYSDADGVEALEEDERFVIHCVPWPAYVAMRDALDDHPGLRMTYLEGTLEFLSLSRNRAEITHIIARLVEAYAEEMDLDLNGFGSMTVRKRAKKRGLEPDECYSLGQPGKVPDIAIEVVLTSGVVNKMTVYEGLGIPEVWVWEARAPGAALRSDLT